jgi:hypothetical protein
MQIRHSSDSQASGRTTADASKEPTRRAFARRWLALALLAILAIVAAIAPAGQARSVSRRAHAATTRAGLTNQSGDDAVEVGCNQIVWNFSGFRPGETVTVKEVVTRHQSEHKRKVEEEANGNGPKLEGETVFTFVGPSGSNVTPIEGPVGTYDLDANAHWGSASEDGTSGFDIHTKITCAPRPELKLEKLQEVEGGAAGFTSAPIQAEPGQTIDYEILVHNTGNEPVELSPLLDPACEDIAGGPTSVVDPGAAAVAFTCKHTLTAADLSAGLYENIARITGTPPAGVEGSPTTEDSNPVIAKVVPVGTKKKEEEEQAQKGGGSTGGGSTGTGGTSPAPVSTTPGKTGVLGFSATSVPALRGPQGCARTTFTASIKSTGVKSVTFYLDGHKLKTLTSHNAHAGLLSISINTSKLKLGAHRLLAKITMAATASNSKTTTASRSLTVLRCHSKVVTPKFTG